VFVGVKNRVARVLDRTMLVESLFLQPLNADRGRILQAANYAAGFAEAKVRQRFMAKVLTIVAMQLAFTVGCAVAFYFVQPLKVRSPLSV
jgi:hypothetical protein